MPTAGGLEKSSNEIPAEQDRTQHKLECRILYVGDSIGHGANLKYLETSTSIKCRIESVRAYSSVMDENARWPSKNFTDVVTQYLRGREPTFWSERKILGQKKIFGSKPLLDMLGS